jgi:hypothetical protein
MPLVGTALLLGLAPARVIAQARDVSGTIRTTVTGQPIPNAEVRVIGAESGMCTNALGQYRLRAPAGPARLAAWYHGVLGGLKNLGVADTTADFDFEQRMEPSQPTGELVYLDGVRINRPFEIQEAPRQIIVINGVEITPVPDRCGVAAPARRGGDS